MQAVAATETKLCFRQERVDNQLGARDKTVSLILYPGTGESSAVKAGRVTGSTLYRELCLQRLVFKGSRYQWRLGHAHCFSALCQCSTGYYLRSRGVANLLTQTQDGLRENIYFFFFKIISQILQQKKFFFGPILNLCEQTCNTTTSQIHPVLQHQSALKQ